MTKVIRIVQHNINRLRIASHQLAELCRDKVDVVLIQEPLMNGNKVEGFENCRQVHDGQHAGAAIIILNNELRIIELADHSSQHVTAIKISHGSDAEAITLVSAYFKYNMPTPGFIEKLRTILDCEHRTLIGADTNGHSKLWHCPVRNSRGLFTEELIEDYDLTVANKPNNMATYSREGMGSSNIDVTLLTPQISDCINEWTVTDETDSDHNVLSFGLKLGERARHRAMYNRFNVKRADWDRFTHNLIRLKPTIDTSTIDTHASSLIMAIQGAAADSMPRLRALVSRPGRQPWWNEELTTLRKSLCRMRRLSKNRTERPAYNQMRNQYLTKLREAKMAAWRNFAGSINDNVWGKAFGWAKSGSRVKTVPTTMKRTDDAYTATVGETAE